MGKGTKIGKITFARHRFGRLLLFICLIAGLFSPMVQAAARTQITDSSGRQISFDKPYTRIVSLYGAHTENLFKLGLDDEIIGVSRHEDYPEKALKKKRFSQRDDPEKFLAAMPDLVLIRPMIDPAYPGLVERLEKMGITVVSLQPASIDDMMEYWQTLGRLTGQEPQANEMIAHFQEAVAAFKVLSRKIPGKKHVYFEAIHSKMKTFTTGAMAIFALETAGGINVATDAKPVRNVNIAPYGKERIMAHADNIDVFIAQVGTMNKVTVDQIKSEPGFQIIKAVRNDQVYLVDEKRVSRPTFRMLEGIYRIGMILYPDIYRTDGQAIIDKADRF